MDNKIDLNAVRYSLEFEFVPELFYESPAEFFNALEQGREEFFANIFNHFCEFVNEKFFKDNPIVYKPEDFVVNKYLLAKSKFLYYVEAPQKQNDATIWCEAYGFAFDLKIAQESEFKFFTVERSNVGTHMLCGVGSDGKHLNFGNASDEIEENVDKMLKIMFKH